MLGGFDGRGTDQDRPAGLDGPRDIPDDGAVLGGFVLVDEVGAVVPDHGPVSRNDIDIETVDLAEFFFLGLGGSGHAGKLVVEAEEVLVGNRGQRAGFALDLYALFGLDCLVKALAITPAVHHAAGELIDDDDLCARVAVVDHIAVLEQDVVLAARVQGVGAQGLLEIVQQLVVALGVDVVDLQPGLDLVDAFIGERDGTLLEVDGEVGLYLVAGDELGEGAVEIGRFFGGAGDDERGAGFVDEDVVDFVDNGVPERTLDAVFEVLDHVVAEVVKAEFVVGAVGDVGGVGGTPLGRGEIVVDDADFHPEGLEDRAHPVTVASGEVVVDGDDVDAPAGERVEIGGQRGGIGLAFAGLHLGDVAAMEDDTAHDLDVELAVADGTHGGFADGGKGLGQEIFKRFAGFQTLPERDRLAAQVVVGKGLHGRFVAGDGFHD